MKAVVFHAVGDIRVDEVPGPTIQEPTDAIVRLTASAICGTDLHFVRGSMSGMKPGTILGHEGVGVVEQVAADVRNLQVGDRVVICSTIGCGSCNYCRAGYYAQCYNANSNGPRRGHRILRRPRGDRPVRRLAGREGAHPVRARHVREAARRGLRRRRDPAVRHLPDCVVRRAARGCL